MKEWKRLSKKGKAVLIALALGGGIAVRRIFCRGGRSCRDDSF